MKSTEEVFPTKAEVEFNDILLGEEFATALLKQATKAPSLQGEPGSYIIIPDIIAADSDARGKVRGWCFEVKDETGSKMSKLAMNRYTGPVWFLEPHKATSYLEFSQAFKCPCIMVIRNRAGTWKLDFFTKNVRGRIGYNRSVVAANWNNPRGIPILYNVMYHLDPFFDDLDDLRNRYWQD